MVRIPTAKHWCNLLRVISFSHSPPQAYASSFMLCVFSFMFLFWLFSVMLYLYFIKIKNKKFEKSEKYKNSVCCVYWYLCTLDGH